MHKSEVETRTCKNSQYSWFVIELPGICFTHNNINISFGRTTGYFFVYVFFFFLTQRWLTPSLPTAISHCDSHDATLLSQQLFAISDWGGLRWLPRKNWVSRAEGPASVCVFFPLKTCFTPSLPSKAFSLFSDACYLVCADELFQRWPGLKCHISYRIFLLTASRLAECKQQGTTIGHPVSTS